MTMFNRPRSMPEFIERIGTFPGLGTYKEKVWVGLIEGDIPFQFRHACEEHVVARVVESRYIIHFRRNNIPVPFNRLSVQYLIDRSNSIRYNGLNSKYKYIEIAKEGILPVEHYCGSGLRGEGNWIPNHLISTSRRPRYSVLVGEELPMYGNFDNHNRVMSALEDGPIYADFLTGSDHGKTPGGPLPHKIMKFDENIGYSNQLTQAVCLVGYGIYTPLVGEPEHYFLYLNTFGVHWGEKGYGRIEWGCLSSVWIPTVPDVLPHPRPLSPSPPPHDGDDPSSHHGGPSRTTQSSSRSQEDHEKREDLKRKRAVDSGGSGW